MNSEPFVALVTLHLSVRSLEQLVLSRQLKGPCWLQIVQPSKWVY